MFLTAFAVGRLQAVPPLSSHSPSHISCGRTVFLPSLMFCGRTASGRPTAKVTKTGGIPWRFPTGSKVPAVSRLFAVPYVLQSAGFSPSHMSSGRTASGRPTAKFTTSQHKNLYYRWDALKASDRKQSARGRTVLYRPTAKVTKTGGIPWRF